MDHNLTEKRKVVVHTTLHNARVIDDLFFYLTAKDRNDFSTS